MRKVMALALAAVLVAAGAGMAGAEDRAGVGMNWGIGPTITTGGFGMEFQNELGLSHRRWHS